MRIKLSPLWARMSFVVGASLLAALSVPWSAAAETKASVEVRQQAPVTLAIDFHVAVAKGDVGPRPVVDRDFLEASVARTSAIYAPVGMRFVLGKIDYLPPGKLLNLWSRWARHALARAIELDPTRGAIDVFVVRTLANVDGRGTLPGVHWHTYSVPGGRYYVILGARDVGKETLAHELGHYFGLDHSRSRVNIMRPGPERIDARFMRWQIGHMHKRLAHFLERKMLRRLSDPLPPGWNGPGASDAGTLQAAAPTGVSAAPGSTAPTARGVTEPPSLAADEPPRLMIDPPPPASTPRR